MSRAPRTRGWSAAARAVAPIVSTLSFLSFLPACGAPAGRAGAHGAPQVAAQSAPPGALRQSGSPTPALPVGHAGRWLVDASGRVLLLHGVNEVVKQAPWDPAAFGFGDADAAWLAANGFDFVRLGVLASAALPSPGQVDTGYLHALQAVGSDLQSHGLLTLLDLHQDGYGPQFPGMDGFPAWMTLSDGAADNPVAFPNEYQNPAVQQAFASLWRDQPGPGGAGLQEDDQTLLGALARTFGALPALLGYDLLNEPWPGTSPGPCGSGDGCSDQQLSELAPFYAKADQAVRATDRTHLVFAEPFVQFDAGDVPASMPLPAGDPDAGLSFHAYGNSSGVGGAQLGGGAGHALDWSARTGGALVVSEWGATSDATAITAEAGGLDRAFLSWAYWAFDDCCGTPPGNDSLVVSRNGPPSGANANHAVVDALVRPHPLAVAGTPVSLWFDTGTRALWFTWNSAAVGGGSFSQNSVTSMELPVAVYPNGYTVGVQGATVTSSPCAPLLTLHLLPHVERASVLVAPGGTCAAPAAARPPAPAP